MTEPKLTIEFMYEIMNYIGELSVKHDIEVKELQRRIDDLVNQNSELQKSNAILVEANDNISTELAMRKSEMEKDKETA